MQPISGTFETVSSKFLHVATNEQFVRHVVNDKKLLYSTLNTPV